MNSVLPALLAAPASAAPVNVDGIQSLLLQLLGVGLVVVAIIVLFGVKRSSIGDALGTFAIVIIALLIAGISVPLITGTSDDVLNWLLA
ncbi:hypothetical protein [Aquipuribacter hungaricus]|uniref:Uncharacterized protein n=1 Tax=Aquipuribacter hungaricus TaxID=545624 RepID=A0ABV7WBC0_9MICO